MEKRVDFLIIGSGIAGLSFALKVAEKASVFVVTKSKIKDTATAYAQGGIAAVTYQPDSFDKHVEDTLDAGSYLNHKKIVKIVVEEGPARVKELIQWGASFDKTRKGTYNLHREGGHSENRVLHHKDNTGEEIQNTLIKQVKQHSNIHVFEDHFTIDVITQHHLGKIIRRGTPDIECYGAYVFDKKKKKIFTVLAKATMIATGGCGNVYLNTTNPNVITGDGIAMTYRAKGMVENMEFMQFHPTALYNPKASQPFLITEALRGSGAILRNIKGNAFMEKYDARGSLAPRDIVARAIDSEMKNSGSEHIFLDATKVGADILKNEFPNIYKKCLTMGVEPVTDYIPVVPAAHYLCGGITVNQSSESSIHRLYAVGEVSYTGLHGANRLASNSLLEALVFSDRAAKHALKTIDSVGWQENIPEWDDKGTIPNEEMILITQSWKETQSIMSNYVGIVRSNLRMKRALDRLEILYRETENLYKKSKVTVKICELRNLINVAYLIIKMASQRKESIGLHCNIDYPKKSNATK
ncbi:MAG: L-aspartate oxidase [Bacteroidota bacterium]|nr:L-aspartate oxidase [Bacteroidota bacterium]